MADDDKKKAGRSKGKKGKGEKTQKEPAIEKREDVSEDFKYIVRIAETDLDGYKSVELAMTKIRGVGRRTAIVIADMVGVARTQRIGDLSDDKISDLGKALSEHAGHVPGWMVNRPNDFHTGSDIHTYASELLTYFRDDINRLKKIRCYRGIRHEKGKKVRGQRTRSNGRTGLTLGVMKAGKGGAQAKTTGAKGKGKGKGK